MMNPESPVPSESKASKIGIVAVLGAYMSIVVTLIVLNFTDFFDVDEQPNQQTMECMSPEDNCTVFQPVQDNPYDPTPFGTEAINGQVPPGLTITEQYNEYAMEFKFGEQSDNKTGHEFILPLSEEDIVVLDSEYPEMATVITRVAELEGVTQLMIFHGSLAVNHSEEVNPDSLKKQVMMLIGNYG